jgi:UDP-glucose 4-epimerase
MNVLVTGGAGYIGSHTVLDLLEYQYNVIVLDNLSNATQQPLQAIEKAYGQSIKFIEGDIRDKALLSTIFSENQIDAVIHFAGLKSPGESLQIPLDYYDVNVTGTITLCQMMAKHNIFNLVFSSSAAIYGESESTPIDESFETKPVHPYGKSKLIAEDCLRDLSASDNRWNIALLRYFNPIGAHASGIIGENPLGNSTNLMTYIIKVANGEQPFLSVYGEDYPTKDGTGVRDYIHVFDLAEGHKKALDKLLTSPGLVTYNLGTGKGVTVLELVKAFERVNNIAIPCKMFDRREGDVAKSFADPGRANKELNWFANLTIEDMVRDAWRWETKTTSP